MRARRASARASAPAAARPARACSLLLASPPRASSLPPICATSSCSQRRGADHRHRHDDRDADRRRSTCRSARRLASARSSPATLARDGVPAPAGGARRGCSAAPIGLANGVLVGATGPAVDRRDAGDAGRSCATVCAGPPRARGCATCRPLPVVRPWTRPAGRRCVIGATLRRDRAGRVGAAAPRRGARRLRHRQRRRSPRAGRPVARSLVIDAAFVAVRSADGTGGRAERRAASPKCPARRRRPRDEGHRRRDRRRRGITGGRGSIAGTVLGVALLGAIGTGLTFLGVSAYWERAAPGRDHPRRDPAREPRRIARGQGARMTAHPARGARRWRACSSPSRRSSR